VAGATFGRAAAAVTVADDDEATVARVKPRLSLKIRPTRDRRAPYRFTVSGRLRLPSGTSPAAACGKGTVSAQYKNGSKTVSTRRTKVSSSCTFRITTTFRDRRRLPSSGRLKLTVRFLGNARLSPVTAKSRRVTAR